MVKQLREFDAKEYKRVDALVGDQKYFYFDKEDTPPFYLDTGIKDKYMGCVVVGSGYEPLKKVADPDRSLTPSGTLYIAKVFRKCNHDGNPHINVDNYLFYKNSGEKCFKCTAGENNEHYYPITEASPLYTLLNSVDPMPDKKEGTLDEYVSYCTHVNFVNLCPGLPEKE
jgi:hypothetical protein